MALRAESKYLGRDGGYHSSRMRHDSDAPRPLRRSPRVPASLVRYEPTSAICDDTASAIASSSELGGAVHLASCTNAMIAIRRATLGLRAAWVSDHIC